MPAGRRLNKAPINIVSNPAVSDPTVRNGLSCIGCHTEGMKKFEDQVRTVVEKNPNPPFSKARALNLYVDKATMDAVVDEDTDRYRQTLEATGDVFGGIEPVQRFHEAFQGPVRCGARCRCCRFRDRDLLGKDTPEYKSTKSGTPRAGDWDHETGYMDIKIW